MHLGQEAVHVKPSLASSNIAILPSVSPMYVLSLVEDLGRAAGFTSRRPPSPLSLGLGLARWSGSQTARRSVPTIYQRMAANRCGPATHQRGMSQDQRRNLV